MEDPCGLVTRVEAVTVVLYWLTSIGPWPVGACSMLGSAPGTCLVLQITRHRVSPAMLWPFPQQTPRIAFVFVFVLPP